MNAAINGSAKASPVERYYRLRAARFHFDKSPQALTEAEARWLARSVARQQQLERSVLGAPEAAGVVVPPARLAQAEAEVQSQYEQPAEFQKDLDQLGLNREQFTELLARQLQVELVLEQQAARVPAVDEPQARGYYEAHPEKFLKPERRHAWHLLITLNPDYPENSPTAALARLAQIRDEVANVPECFEARARRYSECPSALKGGELGWVPRGQLYPQIDRALFALPVGGLSEVIETEVGLHLVQCRGIQAEERLAFEQVAARIRETLTEHRRQQAQKAWLKSLS